MKNSKGQEIKELQMDIGAVEEYLNKFTGNHSIFAPLILDTLEHYPAEHLPFPGEFLFFENRYLIVKKYLLENNIEKSSILDIGCQYGIQKIIFPEYDYIGIDYGIRNDLFYDQESLFLQQKFPTETDVTLEDKIVISSMSLGYFDCGVSDEELVNILSQSKHLFIATTPKLLNKLKKHFSFFVLIDESGVESEKYDMYYFTNQNYPSN